MDSFARELVDEQKLSQTRKAWLARLAPACDGAIFSDGASVLLRDAVTQAKIDESSSCRLWVYEDLELFHKNFDFMAKSLLPKQVIVLGRFHRGQLAVTVDRDKILSLFSPETWDMVYETDFVLIDREEERVLVAEWHCLGQYSAYVGTLFVAFIFPAELQDHLGIS